VSGLEEEERWKLAAAISCLEWGSFLMHQCLQVLAGGGGRSLMWSGLWAALVSLTAFASASSVVGWKRSCLGKVQCRVGASNAVTQQAQHSGPLMRAKWLKAMASRNYCVLNNAMMLRRG